ncbi:MAG: amidohydrolase family protein [Candidatus Cyclobacteriaceae bacterium M2_1C_046]
MKKIISLFTIGIILLLMAYTPSPEADLIITNARIIIGTGEVIENGTILIKGNRILSIEKQGVSAEGSNIVDAGGKTILPGLIDTHIHLLIEDMTSQPRSREELESFIRNRLPDRLQAYLKTGITSVMSTGDFWPAIKGVRDSIRSGSLSGPRIFTSGPVFTVPGGHPAVTICGSLFNEEGNNPWCREHIAVEVDTPLEARNAVDKLARQGVDFIKMVYDDTSPPNVEQLKTEVMKEIIAASHEQGLQVYAHINKIEDAVIAVESGLDGLVHTPKASQPIQRDMLVEMIQVNNITTTTTSVDLDNLRLRFASEGKENISKWFKKTLSDQQLTIAQLATVSDHLINLGTDTPQLMPEEAYYREIELAIEAGLTPDQVIKAATRNAAAHMGQENDLGTVEAGKLADLILVDGNPLEDISLLQNIKLVIKDGEIVIDNREL